MFAQLAKRDGAGMQPISLLWPIASLALMWVSFASVVRRFHDRGRSGWWALLYFVPFIGWLWILIECGFLPGKPGVTYTFNAAPAAVSTPASSRPARAPRIPQRRAAADGAARRHRSARRTPAVGRQACVEACQQRAPFRDRRGRGFHALQVVALDPNAQIVTDLTSTFAR